MLTYKEITFLCFYSTRKSTRLHETTQECSSNLQEAVVLLLGQLCSQSSPRRPKTEQHILLVNDVVMQYFQ